MSSLRVLNNVVDTLGHAPYHISVFILRVKIKNKMPSRSQFTNQHYCLSKYYC